MYPLGIVLLVVVIAFIVGGFLGIVLMAMLVTASDADDRMEG